MLYSHGKIPYATKNLGTGHSTSDFLTVTEVGKLKTIEMILRFFITLSLLVVILFISRPAMAVNIGPYTGQVVDSKSGEPASGSAVLFFWLITIPNNFESGTTIPCQTTLVYTDKEGKYTVPKQNCDTGLFAFFDSTNVIIYKPGYVSYRINDQAHPYPSPKTTNFKQQDNLVQLKRIPPYFNHKKHFDDIERALLYLDEYDTVYAIPPLLKSRTTGPILEKREFLKYIEWEAERPALEEQ